jgi:hypothetical protein
LPFLTSSPPSFSPILAFLLFSLLSLFWKNRVGLWDHVAVCVCMCMCVCVSPLVVTRQRLGENPLIVARQRLGKDFPIVARQLLGRNVAAVTITRATIEELLDASLLIWPMSYQGQ